MNLRKGKIKEQCKRTLNPEIEPDLYPALSIGRSPKDVNEELRCIKCGGAPAEGSS